MNSCYELAEHIKKMDTSDPHFTDEVACRIKKLIHAEKLSTYSRVHLYLSKGPRKLRLFKKYVKNLNKTFVLEKLAVHKEFADRDYKKQIYGVFEWKR